MNNFKVWSVSTVKTLNFAKLSRQPGFWQHTQKRRVLIVVFKSSPLSFKVVFLLCISGRSSGQPILLMQQIPSRQSAVQLNEETSYYSRVNTKERPRKKTCNTSFLIKTNLIYEVFGFFFKYCTIRIIVLTLAKLMELFIFPSQSSVWI